MTQTRKAHVCDHGMQFAERPECTIRFSFRRRRVPIPNFLEVSARNWCLSRTKLQAGRIDPIQWNSTSDEQCLAIDVLFADPSILEREPGRCTLSLRLEYLFDELPTCVTLDDSESLPALRQLPLPHISLKNLWETLHFEDQLKDDLLRYSYAALRLSSLGCTSNIIHANRLILLHGPPGGGKTSLCRALSDSLARRLDATGNNGMFLKFSKSYLVEVNAAALFSKYFSESGKAVSKVFGHITSLAEEESTFVAVLLDEVETLSISRAAAAKSGENMETLRVVNTVLTQLDQLMSLPNVLVLCTTNLLDSLDPAFADRADLIRALPPPGIVARTKILCEALYGLHRNRLIGGPLPIAAEQPDWFMPSARRNTPSELSEVDQLLESLVLATEKYSGRKLRRLPLHALAFLTKPQFRVDTSSDCQRIPTAAKGELLQSGGPGLADIHSVPTFMAAMLHCARKFM